MIEENRLTLMGDPIGHGKLGKTWAFAQRKDVQAAALMTAFNLAALVLCGAKAPTALTETAFFVGKMAGCLALSRFFDPPCLRRTTGLSFAEIKTKRINTRPQKIDPSTVTKWSDDAEHLSKSSIVGRVALAFSAACLWSPTTSLLGVVSQAAPVAIYIFREGMSAHRWRKVAKGDWIVEERTPSTKKEKAKAKSRFWGLVPAPQGT